MSTEKSESKLLVYVVPPVEALVGIQIPISGCRALMIDLLQRKNSNYDTTNQLLKKLEEIVDSHAGL